MGGIIKWGLLNYPPCELGSNTGGNYPGVYINARKETPTPPLPFFLSFTVTHAPHPAKFQMKSFAFNIGE